MKKMEVVFMEVNYEFVPEYKSHEEKYKSDIISYAGKLGFLSVFCFFFCKIYSPQIF